MLCRVWCDGGQFVLATGQLGSHYIFHWRMLANILAVLLGLGSFTFYLIAFFYPEVHRRSDVVWSGLGLFYAAVLWFSSQQMTGVVLLGQMVAVALLLGLGWQTLSIRRAKTPVYQQTPVVVTPEVVGTWAKNTVNKLRIAPAQPVPLKLEKRSFKEFSDERIDPRRRPTYDYEFVEDGIGAQFPASPVLDLQALALEPDADTVTELAYAAPPSAEAEVIRVETPEPVVEPEPAVSMESVESEMTDLIAVANTSERPEEPVLSDRPAPMTIVEEPEADDDWGDFDDVDQAIDQPANQSANQSANQPANQPAEQSIEQTIDQAVVIKREESPSRTQPVPVQSDPALSKPKPSLFAMPLVLVSWAKDVVSSLTKPKPPKPMIVIPRREPSIKIEKSAARPVERPAEKPMARMTEAPMATPIEQNDRQDEFPSDSNWDD